MSLPDRPRRVLRISRSRQPHRQAQAPAAIALGHFLRNPTPGNESQLEKKALNVKWSGCIVKVLMFSSYIILPFHYSNSDSGHDCSSLRRSSEHPP